MFCRHNMLVQLLGHSVSTYTTYLPCSDSDEINVVSNFIIGSKRHVLVITALPSRIKFQYFYFVVWVAEGYRHLVVAT